MEQLCSPLKNPSSLYELDYMLLRFLHSKKAPPPGGAFVVIKRFAYLRLINVAKAISKTKINAGSGIASPVHAL